ncbi:MAG TPA: flagellar biosynthesis protein FlhB [Gemmatimonadales bacterium]|nr:flagellar biosynthesis protein FlhB [Gemmatimonadales bacterium]
MADTDQEKTESATPRKREEAYREGKVPRSQELGTAALLLTAALSVQVLSPVLGGAVRDNFGAGLYFAGAGVRDVNGALGMFAGVMQTMLGALLVVLAATAACGLVVGAAQGRGVIATKALEPSFKKMNPLANARRMVGVQPWAELVKSLLKLIVIGLAVYFSLGAAWEDVLALSQESPMAMLQVVKRYAARMLFTAGLAYLALAVADYLYQLWSFERSIRMTKQEVKQEHKQNEGDPMVKARLRSFGRQLLRRKMFRDVPSADVVIANPTHIAVALRYDPTQAPAPTVIAIGERKVAERIKKIAFENDIPVIENRPLARALLASAQVGSMIPAELYAAVAEVLAFVFRQRAMAPRKWKGARV